MRRGKGREEEEEEEVENAPSMQASKASVSSSSVSASLLLVVPTTKILLPDGGCFLVSTPMAWATSLKNRGPMRDHPSSFSIPVGGSRD